jgi:hypothetical protein
VVVALVGAFDALPELMGGVVLLAGAGAAVDDDVDDEALGDDAGAGLRDAEVVAGAGSGVAASALSVALDFFDLLFLGVVASALAEVSAVVAVLPVPPVSAGWSALLLFDLLFFAPPVSVVAVSAAADCDASALWFFLLRLFFVVLVSAVAVSVESALVAFLGRLFFVVVAESLVASPPAVDFFLDLAFDFEASVAASVPLCDVSVFALFVVLFFLVVVLLSLWSLGVVDPVCCIPRAVTLPKSRQADAKTGKNNLLLKLIWFSPSATVCLGGPNMGLQARAEAIPGTVCGVS